MSASANLPSADPRISTASRRKSTANLSHSTTYLRENVGLLDSIIASEQQIANGDHILTGRVDLVIDNHGSHEPIDFKSGHRPQNDSRAMAPHIRQVAVYTHIMASDASRDRPRNCTSTGQPSTPRAPPYSRFRTKAASRQTP